MIKLKHVSEETGCNILVKAEQLNPGGSVKDRAALFLIRQAEEMGRHRMFGVFPFNISMCIDINARTT